MKKLSKKVLCVLSSAFLMCSASAIPASATKILNGKPISEIDVDKERHKISEITGGFNNITLLEKEYVIDCEQPDITNGETTYMSVRTGRQHKVDYNKTELYYQWYFNGNAIDGATDIEYETETPGNYYCVVTEKKIRTFSKGSLTDKLDSAEIDSSLNRLNGDLYKKERTLTEYTTDTITIKKCLI